MTAKHWALGHAGTGLRVVTTRPGSYGNALHGSLGVLMRIPGWHGHCPTLRMHSHAAFRKLETWQVSMDFVERCYKATADFPRAELYGLTSQIRRAAVSVPSNVAEGYCRRKTKVYLHHVSIALGSHAELETCVEIAERLEFLSTAVAKDLENWLGSVGRLLHGLHDSLEVKIKRDKQLRKSSRSDKPQAPSPRVP